MNRSRGLKSGWASGWASAGKAWCPVALLTVKQAAERLSLNPATVYALCASRKLPHARIGVGRGTIRIREEDLDAFLERATVRPGPPAAPSSPKAGPKPPPVTLKNLSLS